MSLDLDEIKWFCMDGINQFGTNTCQHNKKLNQISSLMYLFWDFPKSMINKDNDMSPFSSLPLLHKHLFFYVSFSYTGGLLL